MSVQSEINRISGEVGDQADLIGRIQAALAGKSAVSCEPLSVTENGTYAAPSGVDGYDPVTVNVPQPTAKKIQYSTGVTKVTNKTSYTVVGESITVEKTGNYKCSWVHYAYAAGTATTYATQLYAGGSAKGSAHNCPAYNGSSGFSVTEASISLTAGQTVEVRARTRSGSSYWTVAGMLVIEEL